MASNLFDLSHPLRPGSESRCLELERLSATDVTGAPPEDGWYVMHRLTLNTHIGTHLEVPYHALEDGPDLARLPAEQFVGPGIILDLRGYVAAQAIPVDAVQQAADQAGGIRKDDIVLLMTGWSAYYGNPIYMDPPFLTSEAVAWLVRQGIKVLGIDTTGRMDPNLPDRQNHLPLFNAGISYVENLNNLEAVPKSRVTVFILPPAVEGLDAMPVRVVAMV